MQKLSGWAEKGAIAVATGGLTSSTKVQGSYALSTLTVYLHGTVTLANLYSDNALVPTPMANPFTVASTALFNFYAVNGQYDLVFSGGGLSAPFTLEDQRLYDPQPNMFDVTASPYYAVADGVHDDTAAITAAVTAAKAVKGGKLYFPAYGPLGQHTYKFNNVSLNGCDGMTVFGDGCGSYDANPVYTKTVLKNNGGVNDPLFYTNQNTSAVVFTQMLLTGPTMIASPVNNLSGIGVQFKDNLASNNLHWEFDQCVFAYLNNGFTWGSAGGQTGNQYLWTSFKDCSFWSCTTSLFSQATNVQQVKIQDCQFSNGWDYYIHATTAIDLHLDNVYMGTMGPNAIAAIQGALLIRWYKGWSEISGGPVFTGSGFISGTDAVPLIICLVGASDPEFSSVLSGVYHPRHGDSSGVSIYWNGGPLNIEGGTLGGLVQWDSRLPWCRVYGSPGAWVPCVGSDITQTVGVNLGIHPWIIGNYSNATDADFYIEIVVGTVPGPATFRWKKTVGGGWSAATPITDHVNLQENLVACFAPGLTWVAGDQWKFPCSTTGLINFAGFKPENFIGIRAFQGVNVSLVSNAEQVIHFNTENDTTFQDIYSNFDVTTGIFTCMFSGRYRVEAVGQINTAALAGGVPMDFILRVLVNGAETQSETSRYSGNVAGVGTIFSGYVSDEVYLAQGDTVKIGAKQINPSATALDFIGSGNVNKLYIGLLDHYSNVMR